MNRVLSNVQNPKKTLANATDLIQFRIIGEIIHEVYKVFLFISEIYHSPVNN